MVVVMKINRKKVVPPHPWGFVVESARRYKCRSVQSAQEYMMYLDTDAGNGRNSVKTQSSDMRGRGLGGGGFDCDCDTVAR